MNNEQTKRIAEGLDLHCGWFRGRAFVVENGDFVASKKPFDPYREWRDTGIILDWLADKGCSVLFYQDDLMGKRYEVEVRVSEGSAFHCRGDTLQEAICKAFINYMESEND